MDDIQSFSLPLSAEDRTGLRAGQQVLLSGPCYTLRDASIARLVDAANSSSVMELLKDQLVFFAGPTPAHPHASHLPFGSIGPTTANRMDAPQIKLMPYGMLATLGKGTRSAEYKQAAYQHGAIYFAALGGAAALLAQQVVASEIVAWPELGTEAVMRLELKDFPAIVAIDTKGNGRHELTSCDNHNQACYPGTLITFEGGEGVGKSTQIRLLEETLTATGHEVITLREPGSSVISESIRDILLCSDNSQLSNRAELLLYEAARAQLVAEVIRPALKAGKVVLCDRFFDSTTAYQGYARGLDIDEIKSLNLFATEGIVPDLTIVLDLPPELGLARAAKTGIPDRLESENLHFHQLVQKGFLAIAQSEPDRVHVLSAADEPAIIAEKIQGLLKKLPQDLLEDPPQNFSRVTHEKV